MNSRKILLSFAAVAACVCGAFGTTYYASPNEGPDSTKDCSSPENAGFIVTAIKKAADKMASSMATASEAVLLPGDYDFSGIKRDDATSVSNLFSRYESSYRYFKVRGEGGDPEKVRIIGPGSDQNVRFLKVSGGSTVWLECVCVTNFGISGDSGGAAADLETGGNGTGNLVTNCVFRCCKGPAGGAVRASVSTSIYDSKFYNNAYTEWISSQNHFGGGAVFNAKCYGCEFWYNHDESNSPDTNSARGGAILNCYAENCLFVGNSARCGAVAGVAGGNSKAGTTLSGCIISNNEANVSGGFAMLYGITEANDCLIMDNVVNVNYGLISASSAGTTCSRCLFYRNRSLGSSLITCSLRNCVIFSNDCSLVTATAAGLLDGSANCTYNCTIISNRMARNVYATTDAHYNDLVLHNPGASLSYGKWTKGLYNCVADIDPNGNTPRVNFTKDAKAFNSVIFGKEPKWGIDGVPIGIKYRKTLCGTGTNETTTATTIWTADSVDYAGRPRLRGDLVDIGAFTWRPKGLMLLVR